MSLYRLCLSMAATILFVAVLAPVLFSDSHNNKSAVGTDAAIVDWDSEDLFQFNDKSGCQDNPDYHFRNSQKKTCDWIGKNPRHKKDRLCGKVNVERNCPKSCGLCKEDENLVSKKCPQKYNARAFKKEFCDSYATDLACGYKHVFTGDCSTGEMTCSPKALFTCETADMKKHYKRRRWKLTDLEPSTKSCAVNTANDVRRRFYGKPCSPKKCPPFEPIVGSSCAWLKGGNKQRSCGYDTRWLGCTQGTLTCEASRIYNCHPLTKTWTVSDRSQEFCNNKQKAIPGRGGVCDPSNIVNPSQTNAVGNILWFFSGMAVLRLLGKLAM